MYTVQLHNRDNVSQILERRTFATVELALRGRVEMMITAKLAGTRFVATGIMRTA